MHAWGCHIVLIEHQMAFLCKCRFMILIEWKSKKSPPDKLRRRRGMRQDGLASSKWPQGSHFRQCSNTPVSLVPICPLWAKATETHCGHHELEEIWQIQRTGPVCFSPGREEHVAHWYTISLTVEDTPTFFRGLSISVRLYGFGRKTPELHTNKIFHA